MPLTMFLTIPLEIREAIYTIYLTAVPNAGPPLSTSREHRIHQDLLKWKRLWRLDNQWLNKQDDEFLEDCNYYPNPSINPATPSSSALPLLLCNRQINVEVSSTIVFLISNNKEMMRYELDCEIVDENKIFPTWLHIPPIHPKRGVPISCVHVTFRFSGHRPDPEVDEQREAWSHGCGGPGRMIRSLQALLNRFLKWGPDFLTLSAAPSGPIFIPVNSLDSVQVQKTRSRAGNLRSVLGRSLKQSLFFRTRASTASDTTPTTASPFLLNNSPVPTRIVFNIHIEKLVLNFVTPPIPSEELHRRNEDGEVIHPRRVAGIVMHYLNVLFNSGYSDSIEAREFILSRLGSIQLEVDGDEHTMYDLKSMKRLE